MKTLEQALAELPDTADSIAEYFIQQECRGVPGDSICCPIANYLTGIGFMGPSVRDIAMDAYDDEDLWSQADTPPHIGEFISRFDKGEWPELALTDGAES